MEEVSAVVKISSMAPPARLITVIRNVINCSLAKKQIVLSFESHTGPRQFLTDIGHGCHKRWKEKHMVKKRGENGGRRGKKGRRRRKKKKRRKEGKREKKILKIDIQLILSTSSGFPFYGVNC